MEYLIIIALQLIGIALHVMQKVSELNKKHHDKTVGQIMQIFWKEDWNTVIISAIVLKLNILVHYIIAVYGENLHSMPNYILWAFAVAFVLGYAGQLIIYRYLGTATNYMLKQGEDKLQ